MMQEKFSIRELRKEKWQITNAASQVKSLIRVEYAQLNGFLEGRGSEARVDQQSPQEFHP